MPVVWALGVLKGSKGSRVDATPAPATLIYDAKCAFCQRWVTRFKRLDRRGVARWLPLQNAQAEGLSGRTREQLEAAMHLVRSDGTVFQGADAVRELLKLIRWGWASETLLLIPGVMAIARSVYTWVAVRRNRFGCGGDHCRRAVAGGAADGYVSMEDKES